MIVAGCSFGQPSQPNQTPPRLPTPAKTDASGLSPQAIVTNLEVPWGIAFLPDGGALVTERDEAVILKVGPGLTNGRPTVQTIQKIEEAAPEGEGGLLGIAVSPHYDTDHLLFIYYSSESDNRIAKLVLGQAPQPIVTGIPRSGIHNGGRLGFGPDGFLYASTGDGSQRGLAQDKNSLGGKILRMNPDGSPASGNPFGTLVYSYGHRNVQGFGWTADKRMYAIEFGQNTFDELNLIEPGKNYGWPVVEGKGSDPQYTNPLVTWNPADASCSGLAVVGRQIIAGCLRGERLYLITLAGDGSVQAAPQPLFADRYGRLRTVVLAPDGSVWFTTSNRDGRGSRRPLDDQIFRLVVTAGGTAGKA
jgi:glucose/arabinose dehydrogenase